MKNDRSLEEKVLEYWFTLEFLGQDKYPHKELKDAASSVRELKDKIEKGERVKEKSSAFHFFEMEIQENLIEEIKTETELCHMKEWGNITVYIGKVKREACIRSIAKKLLPDGEKDNRAEKNFDDIACVSLQLSPEGKYISNTLSLSTIVWATKQVRECTGRVLDCLIESEYQSTIEEMESRFFPEENVRTIEMADFAKLYKDIVDTYLKDNIEQVDNQNSYEMNVGIYYQMFADNESSFNEEDNYLGLSHAFFSDDLKQILDKVAANRESVPQYVLDYISSIYEATFNPDTKERIDVVCRANDKETFECQLQEIMNVKNAPLGKWPSKYMPAFMQQMAINLAIEKGTSQLFGKNGKVFSVNGPPGTGKTTLLKEIVVNNIIERAILLAQYNDPDDAFVSHSFLHGSKQNHAYYTYTRQWHSLKNDKINDYSILVASCNNAAVENISKELPKEKDLLKDITPAEKDAEEIRLGLQEVKDLFDTSKSEEYETYADFDKKVEYSDVYFSFYAKKLLQNENAWGLIAAALGKKGNLKSFNDNVLKPISIDFYSKSVKRVNGSKPTQYHKSRIEKYNEAKNAFLQQEKLVREMQSKIAEVCETARELLEVKRTIKDAECDYKSYLEESKSNDAKLQKNLKDSENYLEGLLVENERIGKQRDSIQEEKNTLENAKKEQEKQTSQFKKEAARVMQEVGRKPLLFGRKHYEIRFEYAKEAAEELTKRAKCSESETQEIDGKLTEINKDLNITIDILDDLKSEIEREESNRRNIEAEQQRIIEVSNRKLNTLIKKKGKKKSC